MGILDVFRFGEKALGRAMLEGIERAVDSRWDEAVRRAAKAKGDSVEAKVADVRGDIFRELTALGAASGGVAALPGAGTGTALLTMGADIGWFTMRLADMIMTIGILHGHDKADVEERKMWVLSVLAFGDTAAASAGKMATDLGRKMQAGSVGELKVGGVNVLNRRLASSMIRRYGTREAEERFAKLMPFGIGAVLGAGINGYTARSVGKHAERFFEQQGPAKVVEATARLKTA